MDQPPAASPAPDGARLDNLPLALSTGRGALNLKTTRTAGSQSQPLDSTMGFTKEQIRAGNAVYTPLTLACYDWLVLGAFNRFVWGCPTSRMIDHYDRHLSGNHLDVGVGTGFFVDRCRYPCDPPRVALLDLNQHPLNYAARRIARFRPERFLCNVLEPLAIDCEPFDSVGINFLLHCLPGTMDAKSVCLDHLRDVMRPRANLFGSTLLNRGVATGRVARRLMKAFNRRGIFCNEQDGPESLQRALRRRFRNVELEVVGCVALFGGRA